MAGQDEAHADRLYFFGSFCLSPRRRLLLENGEPARLGSRALEILITLLERHGELVTKRELTARVWPATVVVEGNLTAQITALRRALRDGKNGQRYILNDPGRGYRFVAPVTMDEAAEAGLRAQEAGELGAHPALARMAEICRAFVEPEADRSPLPQNERAAVDVILQRGIQVLEFARSLVFCGDFEPDSLLALPQPRARMNGSDFARLATRWLPNGDRRGNALPAAR